MKKVEKKDKVSPQLKNNGFVSAKVLKESRSSELTSIRSSKRLSKPLKAALPPQQPEIKEFDTRQSDRRLAEFMKSTLTDFLDLSECYLPSEKVIEYVNKARKHHKIKGLKLSSNFLDNAGF